MDKVDGSMEVLGAMQVTADTEGLDAECKALFSDRRKGRAILSRIFGGNAEKVTAPFCQV